MPHNPLYLLVTFQLDSGIFAVSGLNAIASLVKYEHKFEYNCEYECEYE